MLFLIAEAAGIDAITGGAGWVGASLLGLVLYWLAFHHLPAKDKFLKDLIDGHAGQITNLITAHDAKTKADRADYHASLDRVTTHCEKELATITQGLMEQLRAIHLRVDESTEESRELHQATRHNLNSVAHTLGIKLATGEIKVRKDSAPAARPPAES
jgi:hypothetical protein